MAMAGVTERETTRRAMVDIVSANFFETLGVAPVLGRTFTPAEERPGAPAFVAIASHSMWARSGFADDFLGRTVVLNGRPYTLIGVTPRGFGGTTVVIEPDYYVPLSAHDLIEWELVAGNHKTLDRRDYHRLLLIGRLRPGIDHRRGRPRSGGDRAADGTGVSGGERAPDDDRPSAQPAEHQHRAERRPSALRSGRAAAGARRRGAPDLVPQPRQHDAGARREPQPRDRDSPGDRRRTRPSASPVADRGIRARARRRHRRSRRRLFRLVAAARQHDAASCR